MLKTLLLFTWTKFHVIFAVTLLLSSVPSNNFVFNTNRIEPTLQREIEENPNSTVRAIVQKNAKSDTFESELVQLNGKIVQYLSIINAVVVEIPAYQVDNLAQSSTVRWVSLDAVMQESACQECIETTDLKNEYNQSVLADRVWNERSHLQGQGITVAVIDSGINSTHLDIAKRVIGEKSFRAAPASSDSYGHGTYVAGIIAGNGKRSKGAYVGIAPQANIVNVKVSGSLGEALESDVIAGLEWVYKNHKLYNIRVVNISINSSVAQSYHSSPLDAACEILWFNGIVVVVSGGNRGQGTIYPPANDPFVITVGATDGKKTTTIADDEIATFSAYGVSSDGVNKPDLVAPGRHIVAPLANADQQMALEHPDNVINRYYFMMSGTSVAAPIVSGAVALLLQDEPTLTPDQVKYRLLSTANKNWAGYQTAQAGAGYLDIAATVHGTSTQSANTGTAVSHLLTTGPDGVLTPSVNWSSVSWNSVSWNSVSWNSVSWNSVSWNSVSWNSDYWEDTKTLTVARKTHVASADLNEVELELQSEEINTKQIFLPLISSTHQSK